MKISSLTLTDYRNIHSMHIEADEGVNVIYGENAQGKTNLLESIWLFSGFKSFRGTKDREMIRFGSDFAKISSVFEASGREQTAEIAVTTGRKATLNGVELHSPSELIGNFRCIVFSPSYLSLIKGSPEERRKFVDVALCQMNVRYASLLKEYNRILIQRNSFLKDLKYHSELYEFIDVWNSKLAEAGETVLKQRIRYTEMLAKEAEKIYSGLSGNSEKLNIGYKIRTPDGGYMNAKELSKSDIEDMLKRCEADDISYGTTSVGIHRDNIEVLIDSRSAKTFGSQGQQRSAALSMKLGEAEILYSKTGEKPIALLDDVMSELDVHRQDYILNHIKNWQVFITCCEPSSVLRMCGGKTFNIHEGKVL